MKKISLLVYCRLLRCAISTFAIVISLTVRAQNPGDSLAASFRPPAVPLVACDPYFSIWSQGDKLTDVDTTHWTGKPNRLASRMSIDGKTFRIIGKEPA